MSVHREEAEARFLEEIRTVIPDATADEVYSGGDYVVWETPTEECHFCINYHTWKREWVLCTSGLQLRDSTLDGLVRDYSRRVSGGGRIRLR